LTEKGGTDTIPKKCNQSFSVNFFYPPK